MGYAKLCDNCPDYYQKGGVTFTPDVGGDERTYHFCSTVCFQAFMQKAGERTIFDDQLELEGV